jgi:phosphate transport system permease protein
MGATRWQTIRRVVLPNAVTGILTGVILEVSRTAGETAPIMFTAALAHKDKLPWQSIQTDAEANAVAQSMEWVGGFFSQSVQAMPYHIYTVAARIPQSEYTKPMQYGSVFVFMVAVLIFAGLSIYLRVHYRNKVKW